MNDTLPEFRASSRVFRLLLLAYPASFRREYGAEMETLFHDMARDAWRDRHRIGLSAVWCRVVFDVIRSSPVERLRAAGQYLAGGSLFSDPAFLLPALAVSLAIAAAVTPADPLSMFLVGLPLYGVYLSVFTTARLSRTARSLAVSVAVLNLVGVVGWIATVHGRAPVDPAVETVPWITAMVVPQLVWIVNVACAAVWGRRCNPPQREASHHPQAEDKSR